MKLVESSEDTTLDKHEFYCGSSSKINKTPVEVNDIPVLLPTES